MLFVLANGAHLINQILLCSVLLTCVYKLEDAAGAGSDSL